MGGENSKQPADHPESFQAIAANSWHNMGFRPGPQGIDGAAAGFRDVPTVPTVPTVPWIFFWGAAKAALAKGGQGWCGDLSCGVSILGTAPGAAKSEVGALCHTCAPKFHGMLRQIQYCGDDGLKCPGGTNDGGNKIRA